jgi:Uma2 family endonuclease
MLARRLSAHDDTPVEDHIVVLYDTTWADYERLLEIRGDQSAPRICFLEGAIEIMSPSRSHEFIKSIIGSLVETWCLENQIEFSRFGSWTLARRRKRRAVEPDECFVFGEIEEPVRPDLAIDVIWTNTGLDKLDIYARLGVPEVWVWQRGRLAVHTLRAERYAEVARSKVLPGIDPAQLASFVDRPTTSQAIRAYRARLRARVTRD